MPTLYFKTIEEAIVCAARRASYFMEEFNNDPALFPLIDLDHASAEELGHYPYQEVFRALWNDAKMEHVLFKFPSLKHREGLRALKGNGWINPNASRLPFSLDPINNLTAFLDGKNIFI